MASQSVERQQETKTHLRQDDRLTLETSSQVAYRDLVKYIPYVEDAQSAHFHSATYVYNNSLESSMVYTSFPANITYIYPFGSGKHASNFTVRNINVNLTMYIAEPRTDYEKFISTMNNWSITHKHEVHAILSYKKLQLSQDKHASLVAKLKQIVVCDQGIIASITSCLRSHFDKVTDPCYKTFIQKVTNISIDFKKNLEEYYKIHYIDEFESSRGEITRIVENTVGCLITTSGKDSYPMTLFDKLQSAIHKFYMESFGEHCEETVSHKYIKSLLGMPLTEDECRIDLLRTEHKEITPDIYYEALCNSFPVLYNKYYLFCTWNAGAEIKVNFIKDYYGRSYSAENYKDTNITYLAAIVF